MPAVRDSGVSETRAQVGAPRTPAGGASSVESVFAAHGASGHRSAGATGERAAPAPRLAAVDSAAEVRVLLIEDDPGDALLVEDRLGRELPESAIVRAATMAEGMSRLRARIDCVLLDLHLPDVTGIDAVAMVRERAPWAPLIVLTGLEDAATGVAAVDAGAQDFLVKGRLEDGVLVRAIRYAMARVQTQRAERELMLARAQANEVTRLERGLVPRPTVSDEQVWVAARHRAGRSRALLGGDFYDAVQMPDGLLRVVIGDVCGHGADEAAIGVSLRSAWRALALAGDEQTAIVRTLQRIFDEERHVPSLFTTLCMLDIDPAQRTGSMVRAGHPPPALLRGERVARLSLQAGDPPIGLGIEGWEVERVQLPREWALLLYTDGIIEGRVGSGPERLGESGLHRLIEEHAAASPGWAADPHALIEWLIGRAEELNGGALIDDVAVVMVGAGAGPDG
jgi:serine phosphatase RsbU (regulator of sigma subunit)